MQQAVTVQVLEVLCHCEERQRRSNLKEGLLRPSTGSGLALSKRKRVEGLRSLRPLAMTRFIAILAMTSPIFFSPAAQAQAPAEANAWVMAGANPQRTSWVPSTPENQTEIPGALRPEWYIPIEPYIHPKFQVIAAYDTVFVSTARGLYAFDSTTGTQKWVYPTELPLGNSPTIHNGVAYVGGYDHKIHAVNINLNGLTPGQGLWTYEAEAGFETNPLIVSDRLYAGSRDGYMYALDVTDPTNTTKNRLAWKYQTGGPILYSAASNLDNTTIYFASNDSYGYALNAASGTETWKTKLPGAGFHAWWPVYYHHPVEGDYVIFSGQWNQSSTLKPGILENRNVFITEWNHLYPDRYTQSTGQWVAPQTATPIPGDWAVNTITMDASKPNPMGTTFTTAISEYFEEPTAAENTADPGGLNRNNHKPWRRTYFLLNPTTGQEVTYDFDSDNQKEYAPLTFGGNSQYGNRFPPVVGNDNVLYQTIDAISTTHIPSGAFVGWKINSPYISRTALTLGGTDQPVVYATAGKLIYFNHQEGLLDRQAGAVDITDPTASSRWTYYSGWQPISDPRTLMPEYDLAYFPVPSDWAGSFGGINGEYGKGSYRNPPIPYKGRVYFQIGNSLVAFRAGAASPVRLPTAGTISGQAASVQLTKTQLLTKLEDEIRKMVQAGHLKPGNFQHGLSSSYSNMFTEDILEYFHHPFETFYTLLQARPLIQDSNLRSQLDNYLQNEWTNFNPATINHIGWQEGAWRDDFEVIPEVQADLINFPKRASAYSPNIWNFNPMAWYAMWMYAKEYGNAPAIFQSGRNSVVLMGSFANIMNGTVTDAQLAEYSWAHNGYIAGLIGFTNLYDLALSQGMPAITGNVSNVFPYTITQARNRKDTLLALRVQNFTKNTPYPSGVDYGRAKNRIINPSRSFIFMVPELADYLRTSTGSCADGVVSLTCVQDTVNQFDRITPYWFVSKFDNTYNEGYYAPLYDYHSLFQARALVLQQPYEELVKYLDVPAFTKGDLFYIDNLVSALAAPNASPLTGDINQDTQVNVLDIQACVNHILGIQDLGNRADVNSDGSVNVLDVQNIVNIILGV